MLETTKNIIENVLIKENKNRILSPKVNEIVFYINGNNIYPVKILNGHFYGTNGVSNFWEWLNLKTGKKECGYGYFYKEYMENDIDEKKQNQC